ncbi:MAG: L,D-transpeptidase [Pseudolabrys sp.]|nr:L,D-transpeptidase [Pseudolabrys sp.]
MKANRPIKANRNRGATTILIAIATIGLATAHTVAVAKPVSPAPQKEAAAARDAGEPIMAIVSIKTQQVTFYDAEGWIFRAPVSTGIKGRETPAGIFAVIEKDKDHHSTMYDDAWMPNMQRITWNGLALHGGPLPGYAASHGCIRMPYGFAEKLFDKTRIGMRVIISPNDASPVEFSHPSLPKPNRAEVAAAPGRLTTLKHDVAEATKAAEEAKKAAQVAARETATLSASLRELERLKQRADVDLAAAEKKLAAKTDEERSPAQDLVQKLRAAAEEATTRLDKAAADASAKHDLAAAAKDAAQAAEAKKISAVNAAKDAKLAQEPVSIFISRATRKLYVRRNTHVPAPDGGGEVFDATIVVPVTIRDPEKRIGTHVFTAMARNDAGLRWSVVSVDTADDPTDALDRITFPQDIMDRVGSTVLPRSSIIISDEAPSSETNYRTEFVVVLSNQPQGGFITRKPSTDILAAQDKTRSSDSAYDFQGSWDFNKSRTYTRGYYPRDFGRPEGTRDADRFR